MALLPSILTVKPASLRACLMLASVRRLVLPTNSRAKLSALSLHRFVQYRNRRLRRFCRSLAGDASCAIRVSCCRYSARIHHTTERCISSRRDTSRLRYFARMPALGLMARRVLATRDLHRLYLLHEMEYPVFKEAYGSHVGTTKNRPGLRRSVSCTNLAAVTRGPLFLSRSGKIKSSQ